MRRLPLLTSLIAGWAMGAGSLLLGVATFLATPAPAYAACSLQYNLIDTNSTNRGNTNPGGTSVTMSYNSGTSGGAAYTNSSQVSVDVWAPSASVADCAALPKQQFYVELSRWHEAIFDKTTTGANGVDTISDNYSSVDYIAANRFTTSTYIADWLNDWTGYFNLDSPDTTVASGQTYTVYGDITACDIAQGTSVNGFSGQWARRAAADYGGFFWLAYGATSTGSRYHNNTSELTGGGGKGFCLNHVSTTWSPYFHAYDTITYDTIAPTIGTFSGPARTNSTAVTLTISASDAGTVWLMAFSNAAGCNPQSTDPAIWSSWEPYWIGKAWTLTAGDGAKTVCMRMMDRAGNISLATTTLTLAGGGGDYGVSVQVRDAAGNIATTSGVTTLVATKMMPQVVLGARIVDCAAPATTLAINTNGTIYWPVGKDLCFVPLAAGVTEGTDATVSPALTGAINPGGSISFTLLSGNPCIAPCAGLVGLYPTGAVNELRNYGAGSAATYLRLRLDRETTDAASSLAAVGLTVRVLVAVEWKTAAGVLVSTQIYPVTLELRVRSLGTGQRPG